MEYLRWYDKNPELKRVFGIIERFNEGLKHEIAQEVLQILINDFSFNMDKEISEMSVVCDYDYKRWYDENIDLYTSFELIKKLDYKMQSVAVDKIIGMILRKYIEDGTHA